MTSSELRKRFLSFFEARTHAVVPSDSAPIPSLRLVDWHVASLLLASVGIIVGTIQLNRQRIDYDEDPRYQRKDPP